MVTESTNGPAGRWIHAAAFSVDAGIQGGIREINSVIGMTIRIEASFAATRENEHTLAA